MRSSRILAMALGAAVLGAGMLPIGASALPLAALAPSALQRERNDVGAPAMVQQSEHLRSARVYRVRVQVTAGRRSARAVWLRIGRLHRHLRIAGHGRSAAVVV